MIDLIPAMIAFGVLGAALGFFLLLSSTPETRHTEALILAAGAIITTAGALWATGTPLTY